MAEQSTIPAAAPPAPVEGCKMFVGQVPGGTSEEKIKEVFGIYGVVSDIYFLKDRYTGNFKGCAFVTMSTPEEAQAAIAGITEQQTTLEGAKRSLIVHVAGLSGKKSTDGGEGGEHKLFVGMLSRETTAEELTAMFEPFGEVKEQFLMTDKTTGMSKGMAFIKFARREDAVRAINALDGRVRDKQAPKDLQVRFAETAAEKAAKTGQSQGQWPQQGMAAQGQWPQQGMAAWGQQPGMAAYGGYAGYGAYGATPGAGGPDPSAAWQQQGAMGGMPPMAGMGAMPGMPGMPAMAAMPGMPTPSQQNPGGGVGGTQQGPTGANLFVLGLPDYCGDQDLASMFTSFGTVLSAKVQFNLQTQQSKGFGFVSFDNVQAAQTAISSMDGCMLAGKRLQVRVKNSSGGSGGASNNRFRPY